MAVDTYDRQSFRHARLHTSDHLDRFPLRGGEGGTGGGMLRTPAGHECATFNTIIYCLSYSIDAGAWGTAKPEPCPIAPVWPHNPVSAPRRGRRASNRGLCPLAEAPFQHPGHTPEDTERQSSNAECLPKGKIVNGRGIPGKMPRTPAGTGEPCSAHLSTAYRIL